MEYKWISISKCPPPIGVELLWHSSDDNTFEYKIAKMVKTEYGFSVDGSDVSLYDMWMDFKIK